MIAYSSFTLDNGLKVFVHEDPSVDIAVMNILYGVGSRDERPDKTGFAHLFEHLMFGGSKNIPNYDEPLQRVGGENNAFTNTDITNYYLTLPASNLETGFWLERDRTLSLSFDPEGLRVQQGVGVEEFRRRHLIREPIFAKLQSRVVQNPQAPIKTQAADWGVAIKLPIAGASTGAVVDGPKPTKRSTDASV